MDQICSFQHVSCYPPEICSEPQATLLLPPGAGGLPNVVIDSALYLTLPVKPFDFILLLTRQEQNPKPKEQDIKIRGL